MGFNGSLAFGRTAVHEDVVERNIGLAHQVLIIAVDHVERTKDRASGHVVLQHILSRDRRRRWDRDRVQRVESVHHAPFPVGFAHAERRR
ncbi:unnamed protein product [Phytophthora fragariaefolia]|uniref:Unnamed protein product n=1 Tax=Phytophthora fragariaefolia TaxID=1490495 RepID=A0A9W6YBN6_9STRA|nr:unnamed protein product [Phytophthora fragariaefolia]